MVTEPRLVLLASPLLGPAVWAPVAAVLRARGWSVLVPPAYRSVSTPEDVLEALAEELCRNEQLRVFAAGLVAD